MPVGTVVECSPSGGTVALEQGSSPPCLRKTRQLVAAEVAKARRPPLHYRLGSLAPTSASSTGSSKRDRSSSSTSHRATSSLSTLNLVVLPPSELLQGKLREKPRHLENLSPPRRRITSSSPPPRSIVVSLSPCPQPLDTNPKPSASHAPPTPSPSTPTDEATSY